jgi:Tol biopolymer transport system component
MKMNADGTGQTMVLNDGGTNSVPTFSPDGSTVFFHRMGPGRTRFDVFKMGLDGSNLTELESRPAVGVGAYDNENPQN